MNAKERVCIILVNYRGYGDTIACLESLSRLNHRNFEVIVVDNASPDDSVAEIGRWARSHDAIRYKEIEAAVAADAEPSRDDTEQESTGATQVSLVRCSSNLGFAGGNNVGLELGLRNKSVGFFWLLNNDTQVDAAALDEMLKTMSRDEGKTGKVAMCGAVILDAGSASRIQTIGGSRIRPLLGLTRSVHRGRHWPLASADLDKVEVDYLTGCSILISRAALQEIGLLREAFFMYWEDTEWCYRAKARGYTLAVSPGVIWHKKGGTSGNYPVMAYYSARNCIHFMREFYPGYLLPVLLGRPVFYALLALKQRSFAFLWHSLRGHFAALLRPLAP